MCQTVRGEATAQFRIVRGPRFARFGYLQGGGTHDILKILVQGIVGW